MKKERNIYLDVVKAFCIILVIIGHCIQYGSGNAYLNEKSFFDNPIYIFIYSCHMPLFMLISGYLFAYSTRSKKWNNLLWIKFKQLIIPLASWSVITLLIDMVNILIATNPTESINLKWLIKGLLSNFVYGPWFLWAIWWCSLIIILVRNFFKDNIIIYILGTLVTFFLPDFFNLSLYKFMWPFFLIAYLFNTYDYKEKFKKIYFNKLFIAGTFILFTVLLFFYDYNTYIYNSGFTVIGKDIFDQLLINLFRFTIGLFGSFAVFFALYALMKILPTKAKKLFAFIGTNTLGIYIISNILFEELLARVTKNFNGINYFYLIIESVCILCVSLFITVCFKRFKCTNGLLLGGR